MNRGRQYNAAVKAYRLINERRAALSASGEATPPKRRKPRLVRKPPLEGETFDRSVPIEEVGLDQGGNVVWRFRCVCGAEFDMRVSNARYNTKRGWCSCRDCYFAAHPRPVQIGASQ